MCLGPWACLGLGWCGRALHGSCCPHCPVLTDCCRFVKEFTALRRKTEREPDMEGYLMLARFISSLRDCVTILRDQQHDSLMSEVGPAAMHAGKLSSIWKGSSQDVLSIA